MLDVVKAEVLSAFLCEHLAQFFKDAFVNDVINGGFLSRHPEVQVIHGVHTTRIKDRPDIAFLNLPKVRKAKRDAPWLRTFCLRSAGSEMVFADAIHIHGECFYIVRSNLLACRHLNRRLYLLIAFGQVIGNIDYHIEEHLTLNTLEAPEFVSLIYSIDFRFELSQV